MYIDVTVCFCRYNFFCILVTLAHRINSHKLYYIVIFWCLSTHTSTASGHSQSVQNAKFAPHKMFPL